MLGIAISIYRAWPLRPHCDGARHAWPCRVTGMRGTRCPAKDA
jgi:hypothetical protein